MIPIVTLNASGCVVSVHDILSGDPAPLLDGAIQMRADWPALGTPEFDAKLIEWHEMHNQDGQSGQEQEHHMSDDLKKGDKVLYLGYVEAVVLRRAGKKFGSPMVDIKRLPNGTPHRVRQNECKKI